MGSYCTKGVCAAEDGHAGSCADASGWGAAEAEEALPYVLKELREAQATIERVRAANNEAGAHRFDFDSIGIVGPGGAVGGPNDFYNGCRFVVNRVRAALEGNK